MYTIIETPLFAKPWPDYWSEDERGDFAAFLSAHPEAGDVVPVRAVAGRCVGHAKAAASEAACA